LVLFYAVFVVPYFQHIILKHFTGRCEINCYTNLFFKKCFISSCRTHVSTVNDDQMSETVTEMWNTKIRREQWINLDLIWFYSDVRNSYRYLYHSFRFVKNKNEDRAVN
jgi:hypothetical protein